MIAAFCCLVNYFIPEELEQRANLNLVFIMRRLSFLSCIHPIYSHCNLHLSEGLIASAGASLLNLSTCAAVVSTAAADLFNRTTANVSINSNVTVHFSPSLLNVSHFNMLWVVTPLFMNVLPTLSLCMCSITSSGTALEYTNPANPPPSWLSRFDRCVEPERKYTDKSYKTFCVLSLKPLRCLAKTLLSL